MGRRSINPKPRFRLGGPKKEYRPIVMQYSYGLEKPLQYAVGEIIPAKYWNQKSQIIDTKAYPKGKEVMTYLWKLEKTAISIFDDFGVIPLEDFKDLLDQRMGFKRNLHNTNNKS